LHLIRDCWSEKPADRPTGDTLCKLLKTMMPNRKSNLMDHMFNMLEDYTTTLELDVEERTKQLQEEKKKADILLGRMLPRQVADRLKMGQTVEPEGFESVTVFFSDVVKFTQLAAKCTAFQIVNLLNDLYNGFDSIIEEHSVYKVMTALARNGYAHIKEISELSLSFMKFVDNFRISHLPKERVQLRIGVNSGPCVAGVVGLSMPRYCLFGDTVNTSSRMESNGKPGHIHLTKEAHDLLMKEYQTDYETELRGEVIIKIIPAAVDVDRNFFIQKVILLCLDTPQVRRKFMKKVSLMGMISEEYVYVLIGMRGTGFGQVTKGIGEREYFKC
ncbi:adenylate/guanylate cyclase catalytic domain protein, partial [Teladorsagia circumcincta]